MSDTEDQEFDQAFEGFGEDQAPVTPPADPATPSVTPPVVDPPKVDPKPAEEPKTDEEPAKTPDEIVITPTDEKKPEEPAKAPETPEAPPVAEPAQPLTKDDVTSIISNLRNEERASGQELETTTKDVLDAFYPDGLSNVLTDQDGKQLKTPADVVESSGGTMTTDEAAQWLINEQFKLDQQLSEIKKSAETIAETTLTFKRDANAVLQKYEPLFKAYPHLQSKAYTLMMKQVKADPAKGVILSAPDVMDLYDTYLEPYQQAFEFSTKQPATNPTPPPAPEPPKPTAEDRMDEHGDGTPGGEVNDPNDFAQQVGKELAKGI